MNLTFGCSTQSCQWVPPQSNLLQGIDQLVPRCPEEAAMAAKRRLADNIRRACTTRVLANSGGKVRRLAQHNGIGQIRSLAVLFADMHNLTSISETCPALEVMDILNRYFTRLKQAVSQQGGQINLYVSDEISAVFGLEDDPRVACHQAIQAGLDMQRRIATLSGVIEREFGVSLAIGVGIYFGPVIVGKVGPSDDLHFDLMGDTLNIASRLESETKLLQAPIVISGAVASHFDPAATDLLLSEQQHVGLRGLSEPFPVHRVSARETLT